MVHKTFVNLVVGSSACSLVVIAGLMSKTYYSISCEIESFERECERQEHQRKQRELGLNSKNIK